MKKAIVVLSIMVFAAVSSHASGSHPTFTGKVGEIQVADWYMNVELITPANGTLTYSFRDSKTAAPDYKDHLAALLFARQNDLPVYFYTSGATGQGGLWQVLYVAIKKPGDMANVAGAAL